MGLHHYQFSKHIGVETTVTNAIRISKKGTKPHLLKVSVSDLQDKLRGKMKLRNGDNPDHVKSIFITADYVSLEQKKTNCKRETE